MNTHIEKSINIDLIERHIDLMKEVENDFEKGVEERKFIKKQDFFSLNAIEISEKVKQIPYYYTKFNIFDTYNEVKLGELSKNSFFVKELENKERKNEKYVLFTYKYEYFERPEVFWRGLPPQDYLYHLTDCYTSLLKNLIELNEKGVCYFDLCMKNIVLDKNGSIVLKNMEMCIIKSKAKNEYMSHMIKRMEDFTTRPLEVQLLYYLVENEMETLSLTTLEPICAYFVCHLQVLELFSQDYREKYKTECINALKKYINVPREDIIASVLNGIDNWDSYSFSIIFFYLYGNLLKYFSLRETFINQICKKLIVNIHPEPKKRRSVESIRDFNNRNTTSVLKATILSDEKWVEYCENVFS